MPHLTSTDIRNLERTEGETPIPFLVRPEQSLVAKKMDFNARTNSFVNPTGCKGDLTVKKISKLTI